jgi:hypothetical protein
LLVRSAADSSLTPSSPIEFLSRLLVIKNIERSSSVNVGFGDVPHSVVDPKAFAAAKEDGKNGTSRVVHTLTRVQ